MSSKPKKTTTDISSGTNQTSKAVTEAKNIAETEAQNTAQNDTSNFSFTSSAASKNPWGPAAGYLTDLYASGADAFDMVNNKTFAGDWIAPATNAQRLSIQQLLAAAPRLSQGATPLNEMAARIAGGEFLDPNNPTLRAGIDATINPIQTRLMNQVMPGITDAAIQGGAYGGTGNTLLQTQAMDDYARSSQDISGKMTLDWLNNRFGDVFKAPGLFQAANTLSLAPGTVTGLAGEAERGLNQLRNDNALRRYENEIMAPWFGVNDFTNLLTAGGFGDATSSGMSFGGSSGTASGTSSGKSVGTSASETNQQGSGFQTGQNITTQPAPDMATQILQGGLGGLGILSSLGTAFPQTMGAIGGGSAMAPLLSILGGLSDRRLKRDIVKIGKADNGLSIYRYRFVGQSGYQIGFMADEVEEFRPEAVFTNPYGIKFVDYQKATEIQ